MPHRQVVGRNIPLRERLLGERRPRKSTSFNQSTEAMAPKRILRWGFLPLLSVVLPACWWASPALDSGPRPYPVTQVHQPPKLLYCSEYHPPPLNEPYTIAVQVEFDVTATGSVLNARVVEGENQVSSSGSMGDALTMARSCVFTPARHWGSPVAVQMSMWFVW